MCAWLWICASVWQQYLEDVGEDLRRHWLPHQVLQEVVLVLFELPRYSHFHLVAVTVAVVLVVVAVVLVVVAVVMAVAMVVIVAVVMMMMSTLTKFGGGGERKI